MSMADSTGLSSTTVPSVPIWRLSVQQYHDMIQAGILTDDDPVELIEGWLVTKMPKNPAHSLCTLSTQEGLGKIVGHRWHVRAQEPITTADSEPEPDVSLVRGDRRDYAERHPGPEDMGLVVEVSEATLDRDRGPKKHLYATARIPVYWIINLAQREIEVYTEPEGSGETADYRHCQVYGSPDDIPVLLDGNEVGRIAAGEILP